MSETDADCKRWCDERHGHAEKELALEIKNITTRLTAMDEALILRTVDLDRRILEINHWKDEALDERDHFVDKERYEDRHDMLERDMHIMTNRITVLETRSVVWTLAIGIFFVICQIALHFWTSYK